MNLSLSVHERAHAAIIGASHNEEARPNCSCVFALRYSSFHSLSAQAQNNAGQITAVADYTNYNVGDVVRLRLQPAAGATVAIRYAGESTAVTTAGPISGSGYAPVWKIPDDARTGRYEVDVTPAAGATITDATSFAVHRQLAKVMSVELDKTFYTSGDSVNPTIVVRNLSDRALQDLQVEFEPYTYPWIAPAPDEPPMWKHIVARSLSLGPGEEKTFHVEKAAVVQAGKEPVGIYYSVVIRDSRKPDRIYDLAFALPAFTKPPNMPLPKQYPFLYLYWHLRDLPKSEAYRHFYPPEFISDVIQFDTRHTMFPTGASPEVSFSVKESSGPVAGAQLQARLLDASGREIEKRVLAGPIEGAHTIALRPRRPGLYTVQVLLEDGQRDAGSAKPARACGKRSAEIHTGVLRA